MKLKLFFTTVIIFSSINLSLAQDAPNNRQTTNDGFANLVENLLPAVVNISTTQKPQGEVSQILSKLPEDKVFDKLKNALQKESLKQKNLSSLGSGFIVSKDGYVVTKSHVIENASQITVGLNDGRKFIAKIVGVDKKTDNAVLKIDSTTPFKYVRFGDSSKSRIGDWLIVIGNPFGLGGSVSVGILSARGRDVIFGQGEFIQTDAAINRGNSGGPIFNTKGEVVGIATAIFATSGGNIGIGFANTSNEALPIINQLKTQGVVLRGWIGISIQEVSEDIAKAVGLPKAKGALVNNVTKNGPAEIAGVIPSDIIIKFDDKNIDEMKMLSQIISQTAIGKKVNIVVLRQGEQKVLTTHVVKMPDNLEEQDNTNETKKTEPQATILGLGLADINDKTQKQYNLNSNEQGVVIVDVNQSSKASEVGFVAGDIILSANQAPVKSVKNLQKIILKAIDQNKDLAIFLVKRKDQQFSVVLGL